MSELPPLPSPAPVPEGGPPWRRRRATTTVRIPRDLGDALAEWAHRLDYPLPWLVARILREALPHLPERIYLTKPEPDD